MTESEEPGPKITFIRGPEGKIRSFQTPRQPATHILNNVIGGPIPVNETEFTSEEARAKMVLIDDWLKDHPNAKITEMTLDEWLKGAAK